MKCMCAKNLSFYYCCSLINCFKAKYLNVTFNLTLKWNHWFYFMYVSSKFFVYLKGMKKYLKVSHVKNRKKNFKTRIFL